MDLELQTENYLSQLLDKANELDIEPHFLDALVCELAYTNKITEDAFLTSYFIHLARAFMAGSVTGLKSYRPELVECSRFALLDLNDQELQDLPMEDYKIIYWNLGHIGDSRTIKHTHVSALTIAKEDIEEQKARYGIQDFPSLVTEAFLPHIAPLIPQQKQIVTELTNCLTKALGGQKK